ncbi:MAG: tyrosine-type recombinase/integrase [Candidatus Obscuribacterales bacterium]|nr:tyrosine-type recombinase/integrase [Candidatus Obscuribacterales bacterium]
MATHYQLTWMKDKNRWRKKYRGKIHYFPCPADMTKEQSYKFALDWWKKKKTELDAIPPEEKPQRTQAQDLARFLQLLEILENDRFGVKALSDNENAQVVSEALTLRQSLLARGQVGISNNRINGILGAPLIRNREQASKDKSLPKLIEKFKTSKSSQSPSYQAKVKKSLQRFTTWLGELTVVSDITSIKLAEYKTYLEALIKQKKLSSLTARDNLVHIKNFLTWLYELEIIDSLPRILASKKKLRIETTQTEVKPMPVPMVKTLLDNATERTKLFILLMLNCGMYPSDIGKLHPSEVDFKNGIITRKRTKTKSHQNVPVVKYKLWDETLSLLKANKSESKDFVLTNKYGKPLWDQMGVDRVDDIGQAFDRFRKSLEEKEILKESMPLKHLRKTSSSLLYNNGDYAQFAEYFLCHAGQSVAQKHYLKVFDSEFFKALTWLGNQFGVK